MKFEEFKNYVKNHIVEYLPEEYNDCSVQIKEVPKNNEILTGLIILKKDSTICPTFYLEHFYEIYKSGKKSLNELLEIIADNRILHDMKENFDVKWVTDFDNVRNIVIPKIVSLDNPYISNYVYTQMDNLAIMYYIPIELENNKKGSITINKELFKMYNISVQELHDVAVANLCKEKHVFMHYSALLKKLPYSTELINATEVKNTPLYFITNKYCWNGAAVFLDAKFMNEMVIKELGEDFLIIPSSIDVLLLIPDDGNFSLEEISDWIQEANMQLPPEERLSYDVYKYNKEERAVYHL